MAGLCAAPIGRVGEGASYFAGIFNSAVTGTSATACCASAALLVVRAAAIFSKGTRISRIYVASLVLALILQISAAAAVWVVRIWCPGAVTESFCRAGLFVSSASEAAASFTVLYVVSDRLSGMFPRPELSASVGVRTPGAASSPPPLLSDDTTWKAWMAVFLFWGSSVVSGLPVVISETVSGPPGVVPMCAIGGYDGVAHIIFHMTVVYVMPAALILTKHAGAQRFPAAEDHWPIMRRALVFYALHFVLTMPMMVSKSINYLLKGAPFDSAVGYYELAATVLYLFRLLNFVSVFDVLDREEARPVEGAGGPPKGGVGCCCRRCLIGLAPRWLCLFSAGFGRVACGLKGLLRRALRRGGGGADDEKRRKGGLPARDELSVTVVDGGGPVDDNKGGIDNPGYLESDGDSGYAVEAASTGGDRVLGEREETELGERGEFVGGDGADVPAPRDWRAPATQHGVVLYAAPDFPAAESVV
ncbi:pR78 [rat cytomegalovirus strain Maastricht]|uniref:PR78 n=1 Tax=Rat cytomegalovirus (strain Maastricht) TaxID=79700 RepID=O92092_RCMVM|nr:pR78 [rat cytomegalovirus strain Maastricht]AAC64046.1 pR78 [rat cytomegalovirus strain Maastricht]WEG71999.1 envelope protein UL78 [Murid betaherpesvirus 2]